MTSVLIRDTKERHTEKEKGCEEGGRDWSYGAMEVKKLLEPPEVGRGKKDSLLKPSGEYTALPITKHKSASFRFLASRMMREQISLF